MKNKKGSCPACGGEYYNREIKNGTKVPLNNREIHHILPRRFFGKTNKKIELCRQCHQELEKGIPKAIILSPSEYYSILTTFLFKQLASFPIISKNKGEI